MGDSSRPAKRARLLTDDSDSESGIEVVAGTELGDINNSHGFKINADYARRFEHNKKREERQRLQEKYGSSETEDNDNDDTDDESTDESEDNDAELATVDVDQEILATIQAIKSKDPKVYDSSMKFYRDFDPQAEENVRKRVEKPMYLQDYHRQNLLAGSTNDDKDDHQDGVPQTYEEEQEALKRDVVGAMHAATRGDNEADDEDDDFLVAKSRPKHDSLPAAQTKDITEADVQAADKDPETYLSNFMAARAWVPTENSRFQPFESDNSEDEARAEEFEEAYNLRYENPTVANETLRSFARDVGKYSVRREETKGRKKARDKERERKEAAKRERDEERAQLRRLKVEEAEDKVKRIKHAAGIKGRGIDLEQWRDVIEGEFDDDKWEAEMKQRFGDEYYAAADETLDSDDGASVTKKGKVKKPKWDDDIDINDLIPDFDAGDDAKFTLSSEEDETEGPEAGDGSQDTTAAKRKRSTKKDRIKEKAEAKREARRERMQIEEIVEMSLPLAHPALAAVSVSKHPSAGFRYRETSPTSFGMTARDILFADDAQLNQYAGLKKMAAFRDADKKRRDRKKFSKKARLRQWRKDTFGKEHEPSGGFERILGNSAEDRADAEEGGRKKKRSRKKKTVKEVAG